jgi:hypothetical protein
LPGAFIGMAIGAYGNAPNQLVGAVVVFMFTIVGGLFSLTCAGVVVGLPLLLVRMVVRRQPAATRGVVKQRIVAVACVLMLAVILAATYGEEEPNSIFRLHDLALGLARILAART